jgi:putative ABC transport system substrate-binding protein
VNNRRKVIVALGAGAVLAPCFSFAQPAKIRRFGFLGFSSRQTTVDTGRYGALIEGLGKLGYIEGSNFVLEARYADGNAGRLDGLAAELVRLKVDLILSQGTPAHHAAQRATGTIPIIVIAENDPVSSGLAASLARPGGNITGMSSGGTEVVQKLVELLITALPKLSRFAVLTNPDNSSHPTMLLRVQAAAKQKGKQVVSVGARTAEDIERGFSTMARERTDALIILLDGFLVQQRHQIAELALKHRLPSIFPTSGYAEISGLMSYGSDQIDNYRRAGIFVDKILKGAKPGELPFEQPMRYYFEINRKTANALGVKVSPEILLRADKVIE